LNTVVSWAFFVKKSSVSIKTHLVNVTPNPTLLKVCGKSKQEKPRRNSPIWNVAARAIRKFIRMAEFNYWLKWLN
jgi:hypothetical protein